MGRFRALVGYVVDSVQISMRVAPKVLCLLYSGVLGAYGCGRAMLDGSEEEIERVSMILESLVLYGTSPEVANTGQSAQILFDEACLQANAFIICNSLSKVLSGVPFSSVAPDPHPALAYHPARRHTI